jgi:hypothetical protein
MNTWLKVSLGLLIWGGALGGGWSESVTSQPATIAGAIQAIQQAPDPSAVVAAYGNGIALAPNDPKLHEAYVARMVDMGLPEMAYHQAQILTTLQPNNGLAWGVVACRTLLHPRVECGHAFVERCRPAQRGARSRCGVRLNLVRHGWRSLAGFFRWHRVCPKRQQLPAGSLECCAFHRRPVGRLVAQPCDNCAHYPRVVRNVEGLFDCAGNS